MSAENENVKTILLKMLKRAKLQNRMILLAVMVRLIKQRTMTDAINWKKILPS